MSLVRSLFGLCLLLVLAAAATAASYNYISAERLEQMLRQKAAVTIVDIQLEEEFAAGHISGAQPTYAYPVKSGQDQAKLDAILSQLNSTDTPVVIVCPRGAGGGGADLPVPGRQGCCHQPAADFGERPGRLELSGPHRKAIIADSAAATARGVRKRAPLAVLVAQPAVVAGRINLL